MRMPTKTWYHLHAEGRLTTNERLIGYIANALLFLAVLAFLLLALPALAQTSAPVATPAPGINWDGVLLIALKVLGLIAAAVLLPKLHALITAHETDKNASATDTLLWTALDKAEHFVEVGVAGAMPGVTSDLEAKKSPSDIAKDAADSAKTYLGTAGLAELGDVLGLGGQALTAYLQDLASKKVAAATVAGNAAALAVNTPAAAVAAINKGA